MTAKPTNENFSPGEFVAKSTDFQVKTYLDRHQDPTRTLLGHHLD